VRAGGRFGGPGGALAVLVGRCGRPGGLSAAPMGHSRLSGGPSAVPVARSGFLGGSSGAPGLPLRGRGPAAGAQEFSSEKMKTPFVPRTEVTVGMALLSVHASSVLAPDQDPPSEETLGEADSSTLDARSRHGEGAGARRERWSHRRAAHDAGSTLSREPLSLGLARVRALRDHVPAAARLSTRTSAGVRRGAGSARVSQGDPSGRSAQPRAARLARRSGHRDAGQFGRW
jgi:hypothetical protein